MAFERNQRCERGLVPRNTDAKDRASGNQPESALRNTQSCQTGAHNTDASAIDHPANERPEQRSSEKHSTKCSETVGVETRRSRATGVASIAGVAWQARYWLAPGPHPFLDLLFDFAAIGIADLGVQFMGHRSYGQRCSYPRRTFLAFAVPIGQVVPSVADQ